MMGSMRRRRVLGIFLAVRKSRWGRLDVEETSGSCWEAVAPPVVPRVSGRGEGKGVSTV